ncbi:MAG TPA: RidA family protein [Leptospiraceae bacterium]|nr:RidA family protein [Leptospiraceae bacterium]HNF15874.1 RidA family protein [Leptospiraceae bacterium]HNH09555.1 RidA family protein [Leptospiraceae bacterium]HNM06833.1 RidA family protein [Leptospiraceae bacterium]HNN05534.1 RidA family protein [Leptospiraceae bacterium]
MSVEKNLEKLGIRLPEAPKAIASYIPAQTAGNLVFTSGQLPLLAGTLQKPGKVGVNITLEEAGECAKIACLNAIAAVHSKIGGISRVRQIVKVGVYVASASSFVEQHKVANYASDFLLELFGEKGRHARFAIGVVSLPLDACVELELTAEFE